MIFMIINHNIRTKMQIFAPAVVRIGLALVVLWFGSQQLLDAEAWTGLIPEIVTNLSGLEASQVVLFNGVFEIIFGLCLLVGFYTEIISLFLALHMMVITFTVGYNDVGVRDFGLSMAAISTFLHGVDDYTLDNHLEKRTSV